MKFHTSRYDITDLRDDEDFEEAAYEINLKDGYYFEDDNSGLNYADSYEDLLYLISTIRKR